MNKTVLLNVLMNMVVGAIFVFLNNWALQNNLEETFVSLALIYGIVVIVSNALFVRLNTV